MLLLLSLLVVSITVLILTLTVIRDKHASYHAIQAKDKTFVTNHDQPSNITQFYDEYVNYPFKIYFAMIHTEKEDSARYDMESTYITNLSDTERRVYWVGAKDETHEQEYWFDENSHKLFINGVRDLGRHTILTKTLLGWKWLLTQKDWDVMVRSNNGTYFQPNILRQWLWERYRTKRITNLYAGFLGEDHSVPFVSGCCMLLSRDVVEKIVSWSNEHPEQLPKDGTFDDVVVSKILINEYNIPPIPMDRADWIGGPIENLPRNVWCYRLSVPYDMQIRSFKFHKLHEYLGYIIDRSKLLPKETSIIHTDSTDNQSEKIETP